MQHNYILLIREYLQSNMITSRGSAIGKASKASDADALMLDLGLTAGLQREKLKLLALTDPETYMTDRAAKQLAVKSGAFAIYNTFYDKYSGSMKYSSEVADMKAKEIASAIASIELKSVAEEYPELSSSVITGTLAKTAVRAVRKAKKSSFAPVRTPRSRSGSLSGGRKEEEE